MTEDQERAYVEGQRMANIQLLRFALRQLSGEPTDGQEATEVRLARSELHLQEIRAKLREVCGVHGDNDWSDELHLADVIEKHLARHLSLQRPTTVNRASLRQSVREWLRCLNGSAETEEIDQLMDTLLSA